jgi:hypothetical protein
MVDDGASVEEVLAHLRERGLSPLQSVAVLCAISGMTPREADKTVVLSEAWADRRDATLQLRDAFWAAVTEFADEVESKPDGSVSATFDLRPRETRDEAEPS